MLSMRAGIISILLKNRHLMKFRLKPEVIDWKTFEAIKGFRRDVELGAGKFGKLPQGLEVLPVTVGSVPAEWITPKNDPRDRVMLYFHGGGYISGTCAAHRSIVAKFVAGTGIPALLFEYRLAPENRFPAALDDALTTYQWLLDQGIAPSRIVFVGDSTGGGMEMAAMLALKDKGLPLPAAAVAYSPATDFKCTGESHQTKMNVCLSPPGSALAFGKHYAGDSDPGHPYISPLYGDLHGFPPLLIFTGGEETLRDDAIRLAEKAEQSGVEVTLRVGEGLFHCYPALAPLFPEATRAMKEICTFIKNKLDK